MWPVSAAWARRCDKQFVIGEVYRLEESHERSGQSHRHYFACINEAFNNLPEAIAGDFPNAEALRKYALIKAGYADKASFVCASKAEAARLAAFLKPVDEYAVITVSECTVTRYTAQSQSSKAMGGKEFQASKVAVLDILAGMIGVTSESLLATSKDAPSIAPADREREHT